jgi:hypothetical protein
MGKGRRNKHHRNKPPPSAPAISNAVEHVILEPRLLACLTGARARCRIWRGAYARQGSLIHRLCLSVNLRCPRNLDIQMDYRTFKTTSQFSGVE